MEYKRLGDYIREVNVRNSDLKITNLLGVNLSKQFFPSIANIIGTDLSKYKVVHKNQFGCKFMSVGRDGILPISIMKDDEPAIISSAYYVFEVKDENVLLPDYLMMWLRRPEFDRQLAFYAGADVRGGVNYDDFCEMPIFVPTIDRQREIVSEYETLSNRIRLNEQMIANLEETAQALYRKMFVDGVDKENLPEGWRMGKLGDFGNVITGKTPSTFDEDNFGDYMPFVTIPDMHDGCFVIKTERMLSEKGVKSQANKTVPQNSICVSCIGTSGLVIITTQECQTNQQINTIVLKNPKALYYLYMVCRDLETIITEYGMGAAVLNNLNKKEFESLMAIIPSNDVLCESYNNLKPLFDEIYICQQENKKLTELQSLLLARMGK